MRLLPVICLSSLALLLAILPGCHSKGTTAAAATVSAVRSAHPLIFIDSVLKPDHDPYHAQPAFETAYILTDSAFVYVKDSAGNMSPIATLQMRDSIHIRNIRYMPYMNAWYTAAWHGKTAYIWGNDLATLNTDFDYDGDGRTDEVLYGYTDYDTTSRADAVGLHPLWMRFITASGQRYELHDSGYSSVWIDEKADSSETRFSKPTKVFRIAVGYQACTYPSYNILLVFSDARMQVVYKTVTSMDGNFGIYYDISLPTVLNHHLDTIYLIGYVNGQVDEKPDSVVTSSLDSTIIYRGGDKWLSKTFWKAPEDHK